MKKTFVLFAAFVACIALSCSKIGEPAKEEVIDPVTGMKTVTITATIDEPETRTSYADVSGDFSWTAGDEISVLCTDGNVYTFTATSTAATSTFTGSLPEGVGLGNRAFFPADAGHDVDGYLYHIPESKDISGHTSADIPMVGTLSGKVYSFSHCCGATKLTISNIPSTITKVLITVSHPSLKLSGSFSIFTSGGYYRWNPVAAGSESEKVFSRKVAVSSNTASIFIPYASGEDWWGTNTVNVIGYDALDTPTNLITNKAMASSIGAVERAHVKPLTPLLVSNLAFIDWSDAGVFSSTVDPSSPKLGLSEMKVTADAYYMYARVKAPVEGFVGTHLDIYLSDGDGTGGHYAISDGSQYWTTQGTTVYREEHQGVVTTTSLSMTFNGKTIETSTTNDGTNIYYYMAFPRSAYSLISSAGTVYVSFMMWNGWSCYGAIPTRYTAMLPVTLP